MTETPQSQLVPGLSLTRFENPLSVTLTDPDGHAILRPAGSAGAGNMVLSLRNTATRDLTFLPPAAGAGHLVVTIRRAALDPAVLAAGTFAVTGQGGAPALAQAVWSGQVLRAPVGADWVTLRLSARLTAAILLPAGSDLTLRLALSSAAGSGARGAQVTVATDPAGIRLGDTGLDAKAILHLALMSTTGGAGVGAGPLTAVFRGTLGDRLLPGDVGRDLTLHVTAAAADVAAFRQFAGQPGTRPLQLRLSLPSGVLIDGILPPANATATLSDDGSGLWRITVTPAAYPMDGPLDLSFTLQKLRCNAATPLGPLDLTLEARDLPTPDQGTQRLTARLMVSGMTEGKGSPPHGGPDIGVVQMFGTGNQFFANGDAFLGGSSVVISKGAITTSGGISAGSYYATSATLMQSLSAASVQLSDSFSVAGVTLNGTKGRNTFYDAEVKQGGGLRVGGAWSMPGIYAEDATCVVGGKTGVNIQNGVITVAASDTPDFKPSISIDKNGGIHVGADRVANTSTFASLHIHKTPVNTMTLSGGFRYLDYGGTYWYSPDWTASYAIWAEGRIYTNSGVNVASDARTKQIVGHANPARDLDLIAQIEVVDYRLVTQSPDNPATQRKVIAQQVETVYPQAVTRNPGEVPDINAGAECRAGWIALSNDLSAGDRVRILRDGGKTDGVETVTEATPEGFRTDTPGADGAVFVYGRAVDDLRSVDYDALSMLTLSAAKALKSRVETLEADLAAARDDIARLSAQVAALLARGQP